MATQALPVPDKLVLTEDLFDNLRRQAAEQDIDLSQALARAIAISGVVVRNMKNPGTKVLFKNGDKYREMTTTWRP